MQNEPQFRQSFHRTFIGRVGACCHFCLDRCLEELECNRKHLHITQNAEDLAIGRDLAKINVLLEIEGGQSINDNLENLKHFFDQGVRRMTLTHTSSTAWAGSATDDGKTRGLNSFGKDVVALMNALGMIVDVAHASEQTVLDVVAVSKKPVFCTHSLARAVFASERQATDEMIRAIGSTGGIFGVALFPAYFPNQDAAATGAWMEGIIKKLNAGGQGDSLEEKAQATAAVFMDTPPPAKVAPVEGVLAHIDHAIELIGEDHIGIGTDFDGMPFGPVGPEHAGKFDNLRSAMRSHGYSEIRIAKILGANVRRVMAQVLPTA